jgi:hypothetical protein
MIQTYRPQGRVYIKFTSSERMQSHLQTIQGAQEYKHDNGEISTVQVCVVGLGIRGVRVASLSPEVKDASLRDAMAKYGEVKVIMSENWSKQYRYPVSSGVRLVQINLKQHIPSHMHIAGNRVFITY